MFERLIFEGLEIAVHADIEDEDQSVNIIDIRTSAVDKENSAYSSKNGVLFNKDMTSLICYPTARWGSYYVVPKTVKAIKNRILKRKNRLCESSFIRSILLERKAPKAQSVMQ